jgi:hypothetical protein
MIEEKTRTIIFDLPEYKGKEYRAFCHFGYHYLVDIKWWVEIQVKTFRKKYIIFGPDVFWKWSEVSENWLSNDPDTVEELKAKCEKLYDDNVLMRDRIIKKALNL